MKLFRKRIKKKYTYFCKTCDIFFSKNKTDNKCPLCGRESKLYRIDEIQKES